MSIETIISIYLALVVVMFLHELGHIPRTIKFKLLPLPTGVAVNAQSRYGGLIVNFLIAISIMLIEPKIFFIQTIGLVAWAHLIIYLILGSILPERKKGILDDVPNKPLIMIPLAITIFLLMQEYYLTIIRGIL